MPVSFSSITLVFCSLSKTGKTIMIKGFFISMFVFSCLTVFAQNLPIFGSNAYTIYPDRVVQGKFEAKAVSPHELISNYKSPANAFASPEITFKFSVNGKDNEMPPGVNHTFNCISNDKSGCETPVITFGKQYLDKRAVPDNTYLKPGTPLRIRVDATSIFDYFKKAGYYQTANGDKIYQQDFKGIYVAGMPSPLNWDFDNLANKGDLKMKDDDGDHIYEINLMMNEPKDEKQTASSWKQSKDISAFPQYKSGFPISDAVYNLAMEEMVNAVEPDSTFRTGKEWAGVWTRDISYSIILSMAHLLPKVAKNSLLRKVSKTGRIIQDTGTGGAWPASTDRMIWATAAWELFKVTGDEDWLKQAYVIILNSINDDVEVAYDKQTGMVRGESSFLDWREQSYPKWMQPADIFESECLGTNAVHYNANVVVAKMAAIIGDNETAAKHNKIAERIKAGINKYLWMNDKNYYGQYIYGRNYKQLSPRAETLGDALCVLFGIADEARAKSLVANLPIMEFGVPTIYPQIPNIPPYHNNSVWPFVESYFALAAAKAGNEQAVLKTIADIYRPAALWVTNKENFVAANGDFAGTQVNSSNMLWSLSGNIALVHKLLFGIQFTDTSLSFHPFVPTALEGKRSLSNFKYRNCILDIEMEGSGDAIKSFSIDGTATEPVVDSKLTGRHAVKIILTRKMTAESNIHLVSHSVTPDVPVVSLNGSLLNWKAVSSAAKYQVFRNGAQVAETRTTNYKTSGIGFAEWQVAAIDSKGESSFLSEPLVTGDKTVVKTYEVENYAPASSLKYIGYRGKGFSELSKERNTVISIPVSISAAGLYSVDFRYANGSGPVNTENKCAIRTLKVGGKNAGAVILPQRGTNEWSNWGWSNPVQVHLSKGKQNLSLTFESYNENMNGFTNTAMLDQMRIRRVK